MLNWVFGNKRKRRKKPGIGKKPTYEDAREIAEKGSQDQRQNLAAHQDLEPEILYYFATDDSWEVRREVAENVGTPLQADLILSKDPEEEVRAELAHKIGRLIPELDEDENQKLTEMALAVLEILANDELPRVRAIIAEELKGADNVPKKIVRMLADDLEDIVSAPVLEYSPLLSDSDLLEIVARGLKGPGLVAVARRRNLKEAVSDAVVDANDSDATQALFENQTAAISDRIFDYIAEEAENNEKWHNAMVCRDDLPLKTVMRIASFVSASLMETLIERNKSQKSLVDELRKKVRQRIEKGDLPVDDARETMEPAMERATRDYASGKLTEKSIVQAVQEGDTAYVRYGLNILADLPIETVLKMLNTGSAKSITSLAWKAGLSMDAALLLQQKIGRLTSSNILKPSAGGGYPLSEDDMEWYLESFF